MSGNNPFAQNVVQSSGGRFKSLLSSAGGKQILSTRKEEARRNLDVSPSQMARANIRSNAVVSQFGNQATTTATNLQTYVMEQAALNMSGRRQSDGSAMKLGRQSSAMQV